jgi:hypothetical protein
VTLLIADTTIATGRVFPSHAASWAETFILSALPTLVPPNFITSRSFN